MKLPSSVEHLTNLAALHLRDCKNLVCLPSNICNFKLLRELKVTRCSKLDNLSENLWNVVSLEELDLSGIALRKPPVSIVRLRNPNPVSLLLPYLPNLCSLTILNLSNCDL